MNINSLRNKFDALEVIIKDNIDNFVDSETILDESIPMGQFEIAGFSTSFRTDRNKEGGGLLLYIKSNIPCKMLKTKLPKDIEGFFTFRLDVVGSGHVFGAPVFDVIYRQRKKKHAK